jgi:hypothetical protein
MCTAAEVSGAASVSPTIPNRQPVAVLHGANVAIGGSTFTAVVDIAIGTAALVFAVFLRQGRIQPGRRRRSSPARPSTASRFAKRLHNPSAGIAAAAGVATHIPGVIYLAALNEIASEQPSPVGAALRVAIYDALWFLVPLASLVLVLVRPGAALTYVENATAWLRRHEHAVLLAGSLALGLYLIGKGTVSLLT